MAALVIESTDTYEDGNNATSADIDITLPAYASGDLVIICYCMWSNGAAKTVAWASGPNSETVTELVDGAGAGTVDTQYISIGYYIATALYAGGDMANDASATTRWGGVVIIVPKGEYDPTTPISAAVSTANSTANAAGLAMPAFSAGAGDGGGKLLVVCGADQDPWSATPPSGYTNLEIEDWGRTTVVLAGRTAAVTQSESIAAATFDLSGAAVDAITLYAFIVRTNRKTLITHH
jgi:hypothetical protein